MIFKIIYVQPLKTIVAIMIFLLFIWTIVAFLFQKYWNVWRVINGVLAITSVIAILYTTIIRRTSGGSHTIPFIRSIEIIKKQPELVREMLMNVFLFFPFGLTSPYALSHGRPRGRKSRIAIITIIFALLLSICIEFIQFLRDIGNAELSDIIMNTFGVVVGTVSFTLFCKVNRGTNK